MAREHVSRFLRPLHFKMQANANCAATRENLWRPLKSSLEYWVAVKEIDLNCYIGETLLFTLYISTQHGNLRLSSLTATQSTCDVVRADGLFVISLNLTMPLRSWEPPEKIYSNAIRALCRSKTCLKSHKIRCETIAGKCCPPHEINY